jgi:hypothetical protein
MFDKIRNSKQQGDIGLAHAIAYFAREGYTVCIPLTDSQDYDLIIENGKIQRVQVKTTSHKIKSGAFEVQLRVMGGNKSWGGVCKHFDKEKTDAIFVLTSNGDQYFIPCESFNSKSSITVSNKYEKFKVT